MRKFTIVVVGVLALATTGVAVGEGLKGTKSVKTVAGTFTATTSSHVDTKTCTTADGKTLVFSHGRYSGTSAGDPDFTGPVTLDVRSVLNTTDDVGTVEGKLKGARESVGRLQRRRRLHGRQARRRDRRRLSCRARSR